MNWFEELKANAESFFATATDEQFEDALGKAEYDTFCKIELPLLDYSEGFFFPGRNRRRF